MSRIEDFGEKIHGARKDAHQKWVERVAGQLEHGLAGFISEPLSKVWAEPNYQRMTLPTPVIDWIRSARDELGPKPSRIYWPQWALKGNAFLTATNTLINQRWDHSTTAEDVAQVARSLVAESLRFVQASDRGAAYVTKSLDYIQARAECYATWGHKNSLRFISFSSRQQQNSPAFLYAAKVRENARVSSRVYSGESWSEVIKDMDKKDAHIQSLVNGQDEKENRDTKKRSNLSVISYQGRPEAYVAVKLKSDWIKIEAFPTLKEARAAFMQVERHQVWQDAYESWRNQSRARLRSKENMVRQGKDWRGSEDVSTAQFSELFGFRGVQFGNYVGNERRQDDLNNAFDALMDMAWVLDIAPQSLSLDGSLGLAFGARGRGGINAANAHYETEHQVINLTKSRGGGSLAHEWFHALDHYVAQKLSLNRSHEPFFTQALKPSSRTASMSAFSPLVKTFSEIVNVLRERSLEMDKRRTGQAYWSQDVEIAARAFESGIKETLAQQGAHNDFLVNIIDEELWEGRPLVESLTLLSAPSYPYPRDDEKADNAARILSLTEAMCAQTSTFDERFDQALYEKEHAPLSPMNYKKQDKDVQFTHQSQLGLGI